MLDTVLNLLQYKFVLSAILVGTLVSLCSSLLGVTLVLKRYSMIGDGLSHVAFGALAVATALGIAPLKISIPVVIIAAFLLLRISESSKIGGDSAVAMISTASLAIGVIVISLSSGMNTDITSYMFGSLNALEDSDVILSSVLSVVVITLYLLCFSRIFSITFDESFARATGIKTGFFNLLIAMITAITIVVGMRVVGAMLISALIIFPPLTSMRLFKSFRSVAISSAVVAVVCSFVGIMASCLFNGLPTGASIVAVNAIAFCLFSALGLIIKR